MDLINRIEKVLKESDLYQPIIDLWYVENGNIFGSVISKSFEDKSNEEAQSMIWDLLRKNFKNDELVKIFMIMNETPFEFGLDKADERLEYNTKNRIRYHETPENSKYWLFTDIKAIKDGYVTLIFAFNVDVNFDVIRTYQYTNDIISFMELEGEELIEELLKEILKIGEAEIMGSLIERYDKFAKEGFTFKNPYKYIYEKLKFYPCETRMLRFTENEIKLISDFLPRIDFPIAKEIEKGVTISNTIIKSKV